MRVNSLSLRVTSNPFKRLWRAYETQLQKRPLITQVATSAVLWGAGDYVSQRIESSNKIDVRRLLLTSSFGACFVGPLGHYWYSMLDSIFGKLGPPGAVSILMGKVMADILLYSSTSIAAFLMYGCIVIDRQKLNDEVSKLQTDFMTAMAAQTSLWPPAMMIIFSRVPVHLQLLVVNSLSFLDVVFLSWVRNSEDLFNSVVGNMYNHSSQGSQETPVARTK